MGDPVVERARAGDEAAFRELYLKHRGQVTRLVTRMVGPSPDVDDLVQDVFLHVYRSLPSFRGDARFSTWLYRLTVNVTKMYFRRKQSRPRFADVPVPEAPRESRPTLAPDEASEREERLAALYRLLDRLSDKKRTVLVLHDFEGLPADRIAEIVGAPVMTVRTRLFYARKELYSALAEDPALAPVVESLMDELPGRPRAARDNGAKRGDPRKAKRRGGRGAARKGREPAGREERG